MNLELKKAIDQISKDKGLDRDMLIKTLEDAVRTSVWKSGTTTTPATSKSTSSRS